MSYINGAGSDGECSEIAPKLFREKEELSVGRLPTFALTVESY